jgi:hypothetical protein
MNMAHCSSPANAIEAVATACTLVQFSKAILWFLAQYHIPTSMYNQPSATQSVTFGSILSPNACV